LGFLKNPNATDEELAQMAAQCGVSVTPQAIDQRHSLRMAAFLKEVFQRAARMAVSSNRVLSPLLGRFTRVPITDGSTVALPDIAQPEFAGCGGSSPPAALKLQTVFDLRHGTVTVDVEAGRSPDNASPRQHERHGRGSLSIKDLGYFHLDVLEEQNRSGEYFLSRLQYGTTVIRPTDGVILNLMSWLPHQRGPYIDQPILLGQQKHLTCRLIAWRLPEEQANERRRKLRVAALRKRGRAPCEERLQWCDWTILITNVPNETLSPREADVLYRARWQVELLFKRWKSLNLVSSLSGSTDVRQLVRVWARLILSLVQHWLILASIWGNPAKSLHKACQAIRDFAGRIASTQMNRTELQRVIETLNQTLAKTCFPNKRQRPGTFEILNDPPLLDLCLT
jgi:hypothetical protein